MKRPGHKTPLNPRWYIRNIDRIHWTTRARYRAILGTRDTKTQIQIIRDRRQPPLIHNGKARR